MKNRSAANAILAAIGMMIMILDTKTALKGASDGITSCISTVIPSLFPFILLSCWLNDSVTGQVGRIPGGIIKVAGLPKGAGPILVSALLGGYPTGAQAVYRAYSNGTVRKSDAERLLAFTNNAGPAFIFGLAGHIFPLRSAPWLLWGIHIFSALMVRFVVGSSETSECTGAQASRGSRDIILTTTKIMCTICAWVTVFSVIMSYLDLWLKEWFPPTVRTVIFGLLELVNGCGHLTEVVDLRMRFVIFSGILAFGGACVTMQTFSVVRELSTRYYLLGKILQAFFSVMISAALVYRRLHLFALFLLPGIYMIIRIKNKGRNLAAIRV